MLSAGQPNPARIGGNGLRQPTPDSWENHEATSERRQTVDEASPARRRPTDAEWREALAETGRHTEDHHRQLAGAFGQDWLARVGQLPAPFRRVALAAGLARLDDWSEEYWLGAPGNADSALGTEPPLPEAPYADAANLFVQAQLVLKERRLWPWLLPPGE